MRKDSIVHPVYRVINKPLTDSTQSGNGRLAQAGQAQTTAREGLVATAKGFRTLSRASNLTQAQRRELARDAAAVARAAAALPKTNPPRRPITTGVGEPFTVTLTVAAYFALLFSLPLLLYQAYAFVLPAFSPRERRVALPVMLMIPFLFLAGLVFGYELVLPPAISFLQKFNDTNFDILIRAMDYYRFAMLAELSVGILSAAKLRQSWRYAIVGIAITAAVLPGVDPVTTSILMVPLLMLYGLSILLLTVADRRRGERGENAELEPHDGDESDDV